MVSPLIQCSINVSDVVVEGVLHASLLAHLPKLSRVIEGVVGSSNWMARSVRSFSETGNWLPVASLIISSNTSDESVLRGPKLYVKSLRLSAVVEGARRR